MENVNKTLYIPLYGKSQISKQGIILNDPMAEKIWEAEAFPIRGKSKSKWMSLRLERNTMKSQNVIRCGFLMLQMPNR